MIFKNFLNIKNSKIIKKDFLKLLKDQPALFETLKPTYRYSYSKEIVKKYKKLSNLRIIGMGGSCLLYTSPSPRDAHESRMPSSA